MSDPTARPLDHPSGPHLEPGRPSPGAPAGVIVLTGADLTVAAVEAVARAGATAVLDVEPGPGWPRPGRSSSGSSRRARSCTGSRPGSVTSRRR